MKWILTGTFAFVLFILSDVQRVRGKKGLPLFFTGCAVLTVSSAALLFSGDLSEKRLAFTIPVILGTAALIYTLFFALPAKDAYAASDGAPLCTKGLYGRCRHPGFWPFAFTALCAGAWAADFAAWVGMLLFTALDFFYIVLQDRYFFPRYLAGYEEYRRTTPFLLPAAGRKKAAQSSGKREK